jgi:hypothetical protein
MCSNIAETATITVSVTIKLGEYTLLTPATFQKKFAIPKPNKPTTASIIGVFISSPYIQKLSR